MLNAQDLTCKILILPIPLILLIQTMTMETLNGRGGIFEVVGGEQRLNCVVCVGATSELVTPKMGVGWVSFNMQGL